VGTIIHYGQRGNADRQQRWERMRRAELLEAIFSRWREIQGCNDNVCGESKGQKVQDTLSNLTCLIAATDPKAPIY